MATNSIFPKRLKEARIKAGYSQLGLIKAAGITGSGTVSLYESGKIFPEKRSIEKICKALNVQVGWILGDDIPDADEVVELPKAKNLPDNKKLPDKKVSPTSHLTRHYVVRMHTLQGVDEKVWPATARQAAWDYYRAQSKKRFEFLEFVDVLVRRI